MGNGNNDLEIPEANIKLYKVGSPFRPCKTMEHHND